MELTGIEGLLVALTLLIVPFDVLAILMKPLPPWKNRFPAKIWLDAPPKSLHTFHHDSERIFFRATVMIIRRKEGWQMGRRLTIMMFAVFALAAAGGVYFKADAVTGKAAAQKAKKVKTVNPGECYNCHDVVKELHSGGKHAKVNCVNCHGGLGKHLKDPGPETRPVTDVSWEACGQCHKEQYDSFMKEAYHRPARDEKSQLTGRAPNPFWDKLMMGHGFTREPDATRSHKWMLIDHFAVDRADGGRFQGKKGWRYIPGGGTAWVVRE